MSHSPSEKRVPPIQDETKTPTKNTKSKDVINPSPASEIKCYETHNERCRTQKHVEEQSPRM